MSTLVVHVCPAPFHGFSRVFVISKRCFCASQSRALRRSTFHERITMAHLQTDDPMVAIAKKKLEQGKISQEECVLPSDGYRLSGWCTAPTLADNADPAATTRHPVP